MLYSAGITTNPTEHRAYWERQLIGLSHGRISYLYVKTGDSSL